MARTPERAPVGTPRLRPGEPGWKDGEIRAVAERVFDAVEEGAVLELDSDLAAALGALDEDALDEDAALESRFDGSGVDEAALAGKETER